MIPSLTQQGFTTKKRAAGSKSDRGFPNTLYAEETYAPPLPPPSSPYGRCHSRVPCMSRMKTDHAGPGVIAALRAAFDVDDGGESALGWDAVHAFEAGHGIVLPEPYRTFVAETTDGSRSGPPDYGLVPPAGLPDCWGTTDRSGTWAAPSR